MVQSLVRKKEIGEFSTMIETFDVEYGLMHQDELQWLAEQASKHSAIVNVGCWTGASVKTLAKNTDGLVYAIDPWLDPATVYPAYENDKMTPDWIYSTFLKNIEGLPNVIPMRTTSLEAANALRHNKFDMVFIDALHEYEPVRNDILAWTPLISPGGILCGHDYVSGVPWGVGVMKAVDELVPQRTIDVGWIWRVNL